MAATAHLSTTRYGILVTEESFLKGYRTCKKAQHERKLVTLVAGGKVPPELLEQMHEEVARQARAIVNKKWNACKSRTKRWCKFVRADLTNGEGAMQIHIDGRVVDATAVASKAPTNIAAPIGPDNGMTGFIHLSASGHMVQPIDFQKQALVPYPRMPNAPGMCWDAGSDSHVAAFQHTTPSGPRVHTDFMIHLTTPHKPPGEDEGTDDVCIPRLLHLKHIKEAIQNWDGDLIKMVLKAMELEVVPFDAAKPLEPELLQFQRMERVWGDF